MQTGSIQIGVVMQRVRLSNRWQSYQWRPLEILLDHLMPGAGPRCLRQDETDTRWLFGGFDIRLFSDEAEGYFLNATSPNPCWFVMWRIEPFADGEIAVPKFITLSYNEAARLMDGGEQVDTLAASPDIVASLAAFVAEHYQPEVKKKRMKPSFEGGAGVEKMAQAEGRSDGR